MPQHNWPIFLWKNLPKKGWEPIYLLAAVAAAAKSLQSCPTLCDPIDGSPPGFPVPGILQARTMEWVAISFSNAWKWKVKVKSLSCVQLPATPCTAAHQAPRSMGFSRQEYWSGCHALLQGIFPTQGWNPHLLHLVHWQVSSLLLTPPGKLSMGGNKS